MFIEHNENPVNKRVGDCVIRAISKVTGQPWEKTYVGLTLYGFIMHDMPSSNSVWGKYLHDRGYVCIALNKPYGGYTVRDFCEEHKDGKYILSVDSHVIAVEDGNYFDTWDSGNEIPLYMWTRGD